MNQSGPSDNVASSRPMGGLAKFFFVAWIAATLMVYFLVFWSRHVLSLFRRLGLTALGDWYKGISDGVIAWFSAGGG